MSEKPNLFKFFRAQEGTKADGGILLHHAREVFHFPAAYCRWMYGQYAVNDRLCIIFFVAAVSRLAAASVITKLLITFMSIVFD